MPQNLTNDEKNEKITMKKKEISRTSYRADKIQVGSLVRWPEFPDRLYYVKEMPVWFCGNPECAKIETIDHKFVAIAGIDNLVLDDVDYDEVTYVSYSKYYMKKILYYILVPFLCILGLPWVIIDKEGWNAFGRKVDKAFGVESRHSKNYASADNR